MTQTTPDTACTAFLDKLDAWLTGDYDDTQMRAHHDSCAACRQEARLAREISGALATLPLLRGPQIRVPAARRAHQPPTFLAQLLRAWRQPLVFVPALALLLTLLMLPQLRAPETAVEPERVIIDGQEYTRAEIQKAAEDLQLALRYIERYRPARVISAELDAGTEAPAADDAEADAAATAPTI